MAAVIRPAAPDDAVGITAVFLASRVVTMPYLPHLYDEEGTGAWVAHVVLPRCRVWVAHDPEDSRIVGFVAVEGDRLEHLYLHPEYLRSGIGTQLLEQARLARPSGLTLRVFTRNTDARAFYEWHGFRPLDEDDGNRNEEKEPDMTYGWIGFD